MSRISRISRQLSFALTVVALLSGCQSPPAPTVSISAESSLLAVEVLFPSPLGRDHSLVQAFFVRGPVDADREELPDLIPATFVKHSRAYLLDPEPGTYSLVAVSSQLVPPVNDYPVAGGVTGTVLNEQLGHVVSLPAALIQQTGTAIRPGDVAFMGALRVGRGERIQAGAQFEDALQQRIAERIRPGVTSRSGPGAWISITWTVDMEATSFGRAAADRDAFLDAARSDLAGSPWQQALARTSGRALPAARARAPAAGSNATAADPETEASKSHGAVSGAEPSSREASKSPAVPEPETSEPSESPSISEPETAAPSESPPEPQRRFVAGIPPDSPLAQIELGMHHSDVRKLLGDPDDQVDRLTSQAWIPFNSGPGTRLIDWVYAGVGRVVFTQHTGRLLVFDVIAEPAAKQ